MERYFWAVPTHPRESRYVTGETVLPVFTSEEKALAFTKYVGEAIAPERLTQEEIQERFFGGHPHGDSAVDPTPDHPGREITVNGLHLV